MFIDKIVKLLFFCDFCNENIYDINQKFYIKILCIS